VSDALEGGYAFKLEAMMWNEACQGSTVLENRSPKIILQTAAELFSDPPIFCGPFLLDTLGSRVSKNSLDTGGLFREGHPFPHTSSSGLFASPNLGKRTFILSIIDI
jgi:hypothetical protein